MKKVVAINAGPRKGWNTDTLVKAAADGAAAAGAEVEYVDLYELPAFNGCMSCFACKTEQAYGTCVYGDGLYDVLESIRNADALIIGSPNYLGNLTAGFRALYERLIFQSLTYNLEQFNCNTHPIPVLLITTSNCAEEKYDAVGYTQLLERYQKEMGRFVGPVQVFACGNTLQVEDYSKYNWTMFNPEDKMRHREETFQGYLDRAFEAGKAL